MPFNSCMDLVPEDCNENTRKYIKRKIDEIDFELSKLKIICGMCKIDRSMFKENREKLVAKLKINFPKSMVLLKGNELKKSTACSKICFQQDSNFYWAFGLQKPNLWGAIDVETGTSYIFYDSHVARNKISCSYVPSKNFAEKYNIDKVISSADMKYVISKLGHNMFHVLSDMDEKRFNEMINEKVVKSLANLGLWMCNTVLDPVIKECRRVKSIKEQTIMTLAARLNSAGIIFVIQNMKPGMAGYCTGALFDLYITSNARHVSKARPISCLSGDHVFCMDQSRSTFFLKEGLKSGDLCILNMGVTLRNYRTNLIATVPIDGTFSDTQAVVYNIVLEIRSAMLQELKPGITFAHLTKTARVTMVKQMIQNFILEGSVNDIVESEICDVFAPNGICHFLGIDFYDCGEKTLILPTDERGNIDHLVTREGMVLALNSEVYLNEVMIKKWMNTPAGVYLHTRYLSYYYGLAARIQDVVVITSNSQRLLSNVPRKIYEIEEKMILKVKIPFNRMRQISDPDMKTKKPMLRMNLEKFSMMKSRKVTDEPLPGKSLMKLRYTHKDDEWLDLKRILKKIKESRECKPIKYPNQIMEEVYSYPYKISDMLELVMIPLIPQRRRPSFIPYPEISPITKHMLEFPKSGYGCPYFNWNETFESCEKIQESCLE